MKNNLEDCDIRTVQNSQPDFNGMNLEILEPSPSTLLNTSSSTLLQLYNPSQN
ncbi:hypothetical protein PGB90_000016 [Kerria lacca]